MPRPAASAGYRVYRSITRQARDTELIEVQDRPPAHLLKTSRLVPVVRLSLRVDLSRLFWYVVAHTLQLLTGKRCTVIAGIKAPVTGGIFYNAVRA